VRWNDVVITCYGWDQRYLLPESYMAYAEEIENNQSSFSYNTFLSIHLSPVAMLPQLYDQCVSMPLSLLYQV
jgi:hypothetical protein